MVDNHKHDLEERVATRKAPYHFVDSGLSNVYLVGIRYSVCRSCGKQAANIPAVKQLMQALARAVVENEAPLSGSEIRFLRKRLGKKASEFAGIIGVSDEEISRWENDKVGPSKSADRLIRVFYAMLSEDRELKHRIDKELESFLTMFTGESQETEIVATRDNEWKAEPVLA